MKALVVNALGHGFDFEDIEIGTPIGREVLVDVQASGLCHTDLLFATHDVVPMPAVPSELSSLQTQVLVEALHEAELPNGLLNVVTGLGNVVGAELVRNRDVAKISFTGSVGVGETIMRDGAATMKRVALELGGK